MPNFIVSVREVHVQGVAVDAIDAREAVKKVQNGEGETISDLFEYSHTLDPDGWTVEQVPPG